MVEVDAILERMREYQLSPPEPGSDWLARRELAAHLRRLAHALCGPDVTEERVRGLTAHLEAYGPLSEIETPADPIDTEAPVLGGPGMADFVDRSPVVGLANPVAPPAHFELDLDARLVRGEVRFGKSWGGAPGRVHGGFVAALLDEALGRACMFAGTPAMTAEFTTRYLHGTPVETPLRIEARLDGVDGRKLRTSGEVYEGDRRLVEAEGLFIAVQTELFQSLFAQLAQS